MCVCVCVWQESCTTGNLDIPVLIAKAKATAILEQLRVSDAVVAGSGSECGSSSECGSECVVITCDQIVLFNDQVRGKPRDIAEAREFLSSYSEGAQCHTVCAVVATHLPSGRQHSLVDTSTVHWSGIPTASLDTLLAKEEVYWSCGGFLIEDEDFLKHVQFVEGTLDSIRGLPVKAVKRVVSEVLAPHSDGHGHGDA